MSDEKTPLQEVRDFLNSDNWLQGNWSEGKMYCVLGAAGRVWYQDYYHFQHENAHAKTKPQHLRAIRLLMQATPISEVPAEGGLFSSVVLSRIVDWNDHSTTTFEDVDLALKIADEDYRREVGKSK